MIKRNIPNLLTLSNLACGFLAIIMISKGQILDAAILVLIGAFFDFFDGAAARLLKVSSPLGAQLDSLSDLVTFGVVPAYIAYHYFEAQGESWFKYTAVLIALASAYRLANFNIDERQTVNFIGLPTPANALFWVSIPFIEWQIDSAYLTEVSYFVFENITSTIGLLIGVGLFSLLMNAELELFSLKLKNLKWKDNSFRFLLILFSLILLLILYFAAIPFILLLYLLLSFIKNYRKSNEIRS